MVGTITAAEEAARLRHLAQRAAAAAQGIGALLDTAAALLVPDTWEGRSAEDAWIELQEHRTHLLAAESATEDACSRLLTLARTLEETW